MNRPRSGSPLPSGDLIPGADRWAAARQAAIVAVRAEVADVDPTTGAPVLAIEAFGPGRVVIALGGVIDPATTSRLRSLLGGLGALSHQELILELGALHSWDRALGRVIGRHRIRHLVEGGRVELIDAPAALRTELGDHDAEHFVLTTARGTPPDGDQATPRGAVPGWSGSGRVGAPETGQGTPSPTAATAAQRSG